MDETSPRWLPGRAPNANGKLPLYLEITVDMRCLINEYLSIDDLVSLMTVNHPHLQAVRTSVFTKYYWKAIQDKLGYSFSDDDSMPLDLQVINKMFERAYKIIVRPPLITKILANRRELLKRHDKGYLYPRATLKAAHILINWYEAHDKKTTPYLRSLLFQFGYTILKADSLRMNGLLIKKN